MSEIKGVYFTTGSYPRYGWYDPNKNHHNLCHMFYWCLRPAPLLSCNYSQVVGLNNIRSVSRVGFKVSSLPNFKELCTVTLSLVDEYEYQCGGHILRDQDIRIEHHRLASTDVVVTVGHENRHLFGSLGKLMEEFGIGTRVNNKYVFYAVLGEMSFHPGTSPKNGGVLWNHITHV